MKIKELREALRSPDLIRKDAFNILKNIAGLMATPENQLLANEMVLRALEHQAYFTPYQEILDSLVRVAGLFPYLEKERLGFKDSVAYEFHRPLKMGDEFVFHREQAEVYRRLLDG